MLHDIREIILVHSYNVDLLPGAAARGPCRPRAPSPLPSQSPSRPSPRPQIYQHRVRARRAVEGAHAAQHARCGHKRAQPARLVVCQFTCSTNSSHSPAPRCGRICRARRGSQGRSQARSSAARRAAVRGVRAWARWPRCWRMCSRERGGQAVEWGGGGRVGRVRCAWVRQAVAWRTAAAC